MTAASAPDVWQKNMKFPVLFVLVAAMLPFGGMSQDLPRIALLKPGETICVSMKLYGVTITGADFVFNNERVIVKPLNKKGGELVLTDEEKRKIDEYFRLIRLGERRRPDREGFEYVIEYYRNQQRIGIWSFAVSDARESTKPTLTLYELKDRVERQQKQQAEPSADGSRPSTGQLPDKR
jgi:hypothetical protein